MRNSVSLGKLAQLIRSKNAGPFWITFDIVFENDVDFERVVSAKVLTKEWISGTYKIPQDSLIFVEIPAARAIKFSFPRPRIQGDLGETDMYSGQQYAPLLELQIS
ncbi:MAG: DUF4387 domain-containing protein [SAR324 cluster bacterium]|jgi:hypothetical protein|nr:DUF4387 domain-containing protein [SAR324 cluster bacterium]|tara:strand:+ start:411 stop:728 length:318 start_codon:yes stop_codon:yes gene_type:complete